MLKELDKLGIDKVYYKVWDAVTEFKTTNENISEAHKRIIRYAKEKGLSEVIIAEDDFYFPDKLGLKYFLDNKPNDFDVYLSGVYVGFEKLSEENKKIRFFSGLHFYIVNEKFYDKFLNCNSRNAIDAEISNLSKNGLADVYCCYPMAAIQQETPSDNNNGMIFSHKRFEKTKVLGLCQN